MAQHKSFYFMAECCELEENGFSGFERRTLLITAVGFSWLLLINGRMGRDGTTGWSHMTDRPENTLNK